MRNEISRKGLFGWLLGAAMLASIALTGSPAQAQGLFSTEPSQSPTADKAPPLDVAGTWSGPVDDSLAGEGTSELNFTQKGETVGGTWSFEFPDSGVNLEGSLTGKVTSKSLRFKFHPDGAKKSCNGIFASTSATSSSITDKYHAAGCNGKEKGSMTVSPEPE